jgi:hypothetical protein
MSARIPFGLATWALLVALAQAAATVPAVAVTEAEKRKADYQAVEQELRAGNWEAAEKGAVAQFKKVMDLYAAQGGADRDLILYTMVRAIAEKGLGRDAEASWHWHMAAGLLPALNGADLSPYGAPAKALQQEGLRARATPKGMQYTKDGPVGERTGMHGPKVDKDPAPRLPLRLKDEGGFYIVELVVEADGSVSRPLVMSRRGPVALALLALEKMREWRFEPATRDGAAVAVPWLQGISLGVRSVDAGFDDEME